MKFTTNQWQLTAGWLNAAECVASPNYEQGAPDLAPEMLVIHNISLPAGEFGGDGVEALFTNSLNPEAHPDFVALVGLRVSSHFFIRRDGALIQFVPVTRQAWHAGASSWRGRERCNEFSLGIELEGTDWDAYTDDQYSMLVSLILFLRRQYPDIPADAIVGHSDIAPGRKTDPGEAFDWGRLREALTAATAAASIEGDHP